jgi:hypothetical protein
MHEQSDMKALYHSSRSINVWSGALFRQFVVLWSHPQFPLKLLFPFLSTTKLRSQHR